MNFDKEDDDILLLLVASGVFYQNQMTVSVGKILVTTQHKVFITTIYQK